MRRPRRATIKPMKIKPKYTLDELLDQCDPDAPINEMALEWLEAPPVGREHMTLSERWEADGDDIFTVTTPTQEH